MSPAKRTSVQFIGSSDLAEYLKGIAKADPTSVEVVSSREDKDAARQGLDIGFLWHVLVTIAETYSVLHMSHDIAKYLLVSKSKQLTAKTAVREVTIRVAADATKEEVEQTVKAELDELFKS
jgi:hypothetical protein